MVLEMYRLDRNRNGGIVIYIREDILCKLIDKHVFTYNMEGLFVELSFKICKWLLFEIYQPLSHGNIYYSDNLDKAFDTYSSYKKPLLIGDFNTDMIEPRLDSFVYEHE